MKQPPRILFIGQIDTAEFQAAAEQIRASAETRFALDLVAAERVLLAGDFRPQLLVLAATRPDEHSHRQVQLLRRHAPLARIVGLLGSWCEGEARSGQPWPGVPRIYWHQWASRWRHDLQLWQSGKSPRWGLPATMEEDERLSEFQQPRPIPRRGLIAIDTPSALAAEALADACRWGGYSTVWLRAMETTRVTGVSAILWDGELDSPRRVAAIGSLRQQFPGVPLLAVVGFPRTADIAQLNLLGIQGVISKPLLLSDLHQQLNRALSTHQKQAGDSEAA